MLTTIQLIDYYNQILNSKEDPTLLIQLTISLALFLFIYFIIFPKHVKLQPSKNIILITGCDTGFGNMLAKKCNLHGYQVVAACLTDVGVKEMKGLNVTLAIKVDVTNKNDINKMTTEVQSIIDTSDMRLWAIVNNAGIAPMGYLDWCPEDRYQRVMDINYFGIVSVIKSTLPLLKATRGSRIINVSSCAGLFGSTGLSAYSASKFAVEGMSQSLRFELRKWGVHVANVNPAFMKTPLIMSSITAGIKDLKESKECSQYPDDVLDGSTNTVLAVLEDPTKVVNSIFSILTQTAPGLVNYVGIQDLTNPTVGPLPEALEKFQGKK